LPSCCHLSTDFRSMPIVRLNWRDNAALVLPMTLRT
jgi:hypothetical protein